MWRAPSAAGCLLLLAACGGEPRAADPDGQSCERFPERPGEATYYAADGSGNCSFPVVTGGPPLVAALSDDDYDGARACGACVFVRGPEGEALVRVVDRCPGCEEGHIDLSQEAFERIAPLEAGRVDVTWQQVACETDAPLRLRFRDGTNPWWAAVQVDHHRHAIASLSYRQSSGAAQGIAQNLASAADFTELERALHNDFVAEDGLGEAPVDFRVRDVHDHEIVIESVQPGDGVEIEAEAQFPQCAHAPE